MNTGKFNLKLLVAWLKQYLADPLRRNALFLMASGGISSLLGFFLWLIAARLYSSEEVGLATALLSSMNLLTIISRLGFTSGIVRFLPETNNRTNLINTCFTVTGVLSIISAGIFVLGIGVWSPKLLFIQQNWLYALAFLIATALTSVSQLQGQVFIVFRAAHYNFFLSAFNGLKLIFIIMLTGQGAFGIFASTGLFSVLVVIIGILLLFRLMPEYKPIPAFGKGVSGEMLHFSMGNYFAGFLASLPVYLMPLLIINILTPESSAYFNISYSIAGILGLVTGSTASALLTEGSHSQTGFSRQIIKSLKFISIFLIPGILLVFVFGRVILSWYGSEYAQNSLNLLRLFILSYLPITVNTLYMTLAQVQKNIRAIIILNSALAILAIALSCILMKTMGLIGVGIAILSAQSGVAIITGTKMFKITRK